MRYRRSPEEQAMYDRLAMTVGCVHCPDWSHTGPAGEAREAARSHRAEAHPELPLVAVRPRKRSAPVQQSPSSADQKLVATLAERRRTMSSVSRSRLSEEQVAIAVRRYESGESVRSIAADVFEEWGYGSLDSLSVALYRLLPERVSKWQSREREGPVMVGRREGRSRIQLLRDEEDDPWEIAS